VHVGGAPCKQSDLMKSAVTVACVQAEPVILDREATLDKLAALTAEAAGNGAELIVFPETFVSVYPSSAWAKAFAGWGDPRAKAAFAQIVDSAVEIPGPDADRLGEIAREHSVWLVTGINGLDSTRNGTVYNALLYHAPDGSLALEHRKLVPTNHERLVWGQGDGRGLRAIETPFGRLGGLICWENYMPLARFSLYESGIEIYLAPTADDSDAWQSTLVHIARESRAFVVAPSHFQRASAYPEDSRFGSCSKGTTSSGAAAARFSPPTAPTSPGRCTGRRGSFTPSSSPRGSTRSGSASMRPVTTTGRTFSA